MPAYKRKKTEGEKAAQRRRTHRNKVKKYKKLLTEYPNSPARKIWERKLEYSQRYV